MLVYHYDFKTKEYIGSSQAWPSPLEKDVFLCPANATFIEPPNATSASKFIDGKWVVS